MRSVSSIVPPKTYKIFSYYFNIPFRDCQPSGRKTSKKVPMGEKRKTKKEQKILLLFDDDWTFFCSALFVKNT